MDSSQLADAIAAVTVEAEPDFRKRRRTLIRLAVGQLDAGDMDGYRTAVAAVEEQGDPNRPGVRFAYQQAPAVRGMYADKPQILALKGKHGTDYLDIGTPDDFARAFLATVKERLEEGWYDVEDPYMPEVPQPMGDAFLATIEGSDALIAVQAAADKAGPAFSAAVKAWRKTPEFVALVSKDMSDYTLFKGLQKAVTEGATDAHVTFLADALLVRSETFGGLVSTALGDRDPGSLSSRIIPSIAQDDENRARAMLADAAVDPAHLRRAGRQAYDLLSSRDGQEYEGFEIISAPRAELDLDGYKPGIGAAAPTR